MQGLSTFSFRVRNRARADIYKEEIVHQQLLKDQIRSIIITLPLELAASISMFAQTQNTIPCEYPGLLSTTPWTVPMAIHGTAMI
jgi:hypothetical protein